MTTFADLPIQPVFSPQGINPAIVQVQEGAGQTFKAGTLLVYSAGQVSEIASDTPAQIYCVAAADATGVQGTLIPVYLIREDVWFEMTMKQAALANHTFALADIGVPMAIQRDTPNKKTFLNASVTGGAGVRVFVHMPSPKFATTAVGDINIRALVSFLPGNSQF